MSELNHSEKESRRKLKQAGVDIVKISLDNKGSYEQALIEAERTLLSLQFDGLKTGSENIESLLNQVNESLDEIHSGRHELTYLPTGLVDLDEILCGLDAGGLYVIGGNPGSGKTALGLSILRHISVQQKLPSGIISLDLSSMHVAFRLLCMEARVDSHLLRTGKLPKSQWKAFTLKMESLTESSIFIDAPAYLSPLKIKHIAIRMKAELDIQFLFVDSIPKFTKRKSAKLSYQLIKQLATDLDIPVITTLGFEVYNDRPPTLGDLQYADVAYEYANTIMLLHRPWIYSQVEEDKESVDVIVVVNKNGPTGIANMRFMEKYSAFENMIGV